MSYLNLPNLHFKRQFKTNVATANNDVRHYNMDEFMPLDSLSREEGGQGFWNPRGTNDFMLNDVYVTSVCYQDGRCVASKSDDHICGIEIRGKMTNRSRIWQVFLERKEQQERCLQELSYSQGLQECTYI